MPFQTATPIQRPNLLRARHDLSHLYKGMRLRPLSEHIEFPWARATFLRECASRLAPSPIGGETNFQVSGEHRKHRNVTKQNILEPVRPKRLAGYGIRASPKRQDQKTISPLTFLRPLRKEATQKMIRFA